MLKGIYIHLRCKVKFGVMSNALNKNSISACLNNETYLKHCIVAFRNLKGLHLVSRGQEAVNS